MKIFECKICKKKFPFREITSSSELLLFTHLSLAHEWLETVAIAYNVEEMEEDDAIQKLQTRIRNDDQRPERVEEVGKEIWSC